MSSAPTETTANLTDAAQRLLAARKNYTDTAQLQQQQPVQMPGMLSNDGYVQQQMPMQVNVAEPPVLDRQGMNVDGNNLDMKVNDNAYHVIASVVADKLEYQKSSNVPQDVIDAQIDSLLPQNLQVSFVEATKFRLESVNVMGGPLVPGSIQDLVVKCKDFQPTATIMKPPATPISATASSSRYQPPTSLQGTGVGGLSPGTGAVDIASSKDKTTVTANNMAIQSKARQQLMSEIEESKRLQQSATTEEAARFWKKHMDVLYASLARIQGEEAKAAADEEANSKQQPTPQPTSVGGANVNTNSSIPGKKVWVIAPANLPGGYRFEAQLDDRKFLATVPPGGVVKGQTFLTEYRDLERVVMSVPVGSWRDGICDCFNSGLCHPLLLTTIFCPLISLGQIMTRSRLTWTGGVGPLVETRMTFTSMWIIIFSYIVLNLVFILMPLTKDHPFLDGENGEDGIDWSELGPVVALNAAFIFYSICAVARTRSAIKEKYSIEDGGCGDAEDLLAAVVCYPCSICQMGRHTADYDTIRAVCCSSTGLPAKVECPEGPSESLSMYGGKGQGLV